MKKDRSELAWTEVSSEHIVQDEWIDIKRLRYRFPDGTEFEPYYSYSRKNYVVIVALDTEGRAICVRQFRQGIKKVTCEFPAGGIEPGEDPFESARRELREETGYEAGKWTHLITEPSNATLANNFAHVYLAENCHKVSGQDLDDTEFLNVEIYSEEDLEQMIFSGDFEQSVHVMAWFIAKDKMRG